MPRHPASLPSSPSPRRSWEHQLRQLWVMHSMLECSREKLSISQSPVEPAKHLSLTSVGFGWAKTVPSPEPLQHPLGGPSPATPNSEQGGLRHSKGQTVEVERGCPGGSYLKVNAFPGCKKQSPPWGWGLCFQALAEHEHHCCPLHPRSPPSSSSFGEASPALAWPKHAVLTIYCRKLVGGFFFLPPPWQKGPAAASPGGCVGSWPNKHCPLPLPCSSSFRAGVFLGVWWAGAHWGCERLVLPLMH